MKRLGGGWPMLRLPATEHAGRSRRIALSFVLAAGLAACSSGGASDGGSATFPKAPLAVVDSMNGLVIEVRTAPDQPPTRGQSSVELTVRNAKGEAQDGIDLAVVPWMPEMGHGASTLPTTVVKGGGKYVLTGVDLFMPGSWDLRVTLSGSVTDSATITLQIP